MAFSLRGNLILKFMAASAAMLVVGASPFAPHAAAEGDQVIQLQDGQLRCLLSANYQGRGVFRIDDHDLEVIRSAMVVSESEETTVGT